ncbi:uncharacterized protein A4U43_C01F18050 [Asparagus officinalis]|uniref:Uncharacterized protein n=1 Tax=Asparagus officinalis TaxID=4686 RepID=A0A5P1FTX8_ASPOF|nr:uncharacterized protein A4U43_C01F18050 [Asparagus officinalis]
MHKISGLPIGQILYQSEPLAKRTKSHVSLKQFASYLFRNLESNSGEAICELAPLTPSGVNSLLKKIDAHSYTISSLESGFPAGTKFKSFLWHATAPIRPMTLLTGYLAIWLKKCVVPYQSGDTFPLEMLYPAVQLAYKKELSLLPMMVIEGFDRFLVLLHGKKVNRRLRFLLLSCLRMASGRDEDSLTSESSYRSTSVGHSPLAFRSSPVDMASV